MQPTDVDVLIVGAGPSGLMLATWLSKLNIKTRIIDKRSTKVFTGQADGVQCRTVEVFQSFGFANRLVDEGAHINEVVFWAPGENGGIERTKRTPDTEPGTSRFPHAVLTQGRIERFMLDAIKAHNGLEVERAIAPTKLELLPSHVEVTLRHLTEEEATPTQVGTVQNGLFRSNLMKDDELDAKPSGTGGGDVKEEVVRAKYVVGCDGARSWVRKQMGLNLDGDSADVYWGVVDVLVLTDFPDIRLKCTIKSEQHGTILVVPREKGLVRLYVQLGETERGERVDRAGISVESIIAKAQAIMAPYKLECPFVEWWTIYEVGQRLCASVSLEDRVFIAGDAFHTHSPKAGQGMNISMMDTYNLGWKLAGVIKGSLQASILKTYQSERHQTAKELIDIDYKLSRYFSGKNGERPLDGVTPEEFKNFFITLGKWASGTAVCYRPSLIVSEEGDAATLAPAIGVGRRFPSSQVVRVSDAKPVHLGDLLVSDSRFRVLLFAGDVRKQSQMDKLAAAAEYLDSASGPVRRFTPSSADIDSVIEVITVTSSPRIETESNTYPDSLWPAKGKYGCRDYDKIFADDDTYVAGHGHAYDKYGIDKDAGCVVVVRPDQYTALICRLEEIQSLGQYFEGFMIPV